MSTAVIPLSSVSTAEFSELKPEVDGMPVIVDGEKLADILWPRPLAEYEYSVVLHIRNTRTKP